VTYRRTDRNPISLSRVNVLSNDENEEGKEEEEIYLLLST